MRETFENCIGRALPVRLPHRGISTQLMSVGASKGTDCHRAARELAEDCMSRKAGKSQLEFLIKVTKARLPARQAFVANMLGNVRQLLRDLPLDRPLIEYTDEEIIALVRRMFRATSAKGSLSNRSIGGRKRKR